MSTEYADIFPIVVTRPNGGTSTEMRDISSVSITVAQEKNPVQPMNRSRLATGYTRASRKITWEMEASVPLDGLQVDWWEIQSRGEECLGQIEMGDGGARFQLVDFVVDEINPSTNADGQAVCRLRGKAIDFRPDRANSLGL